MRKVKEMLVLPKFSLTDSVSIEGDQSEPNAQGRKENQSLKVNSRSSSSEQPSNH